MTGETLRRRLSHIKKTAAQWGELIGVSDKTIYRLFKANDVRTATVERLCQALDVPISFLYEADDSSDEGKGTVKASLIRIKSEEEALTPQPRDYPVERTFNLDKKVSELLAAQHRKVGDLAHYMGVSYSTVTRMCANNSCSLASLMKIANFFQVPITYFLPTDRLAIEEAEKDRQIHFLKGQIEVYRKTLATLLHNDG